MRNRGMVAIVDYGMGNLFSVKTACGQVGLEARITSSARDLSLADSVLLPGVGAFGDAMDALRRLDLLAVLRDVAASGKPLVGICLGLQLFMNESEEFGRHDGLGLIAGRVVPLGSPSGNGRRLKVPQVGWNQLRPANQSWDDSLLRGVTEGAYVYFVHSFIVEPQDPKPILSMTTYGDVNFCSSLQSGNVFGCQFHPERSGSTGLGIYRNLAAKLLHSKLP